MTGLEMLAEIEHREYYDRKEREHIELVDCMTYAAIWLVIIVCLLSIARHVQELWDGLISGL